MNQFRDIPDELANWENQPDDVNIIIGQNGSGKSTLLHDLSNYYSRRNKNVIAIANSIHDKFETRHRNIKVLRGRSGRKQTRSTIKRALETIGRRIEKDRLSSATRALEYVGFDPVIGFKIEGFRPYLLEDLSIEVNESLTPESLDRIRYLFQRSERERIHGEIVWFEPQYLDFNELEKSNLTELFVWEPILRKLKIISRIEVYLRKQNNVLSMLNASSGELALITTIVYISTVIDENTVILIDEPENSLHPLWQKEYTKNLLDIFYYYQPKIVIATHSPLIVNGAELFAENSKVFKAENFEFKIQVKEPLNVEEIFFRFFDITTPRNRFLSDRLIRLLNLLVEQKISLSNFNNEVDRMKLMAYHDEQTEALSVVQSLAEQIDSTQQ